VPQDRDGRFSTELFERYQRPERALVTLSSWLPTTMPA
jgi:transposase-like protein